MFLGTLARHADFVSLSSTWIDSSPSTQHLFPFLRHLFPLFLFLLRVYFPELLSSVTSVDVVSEADSGPSHPEIPAVALLDIQTPRF